MAQVNFIGRDQAWLEDKLSRLQNAKAIGQRFFRIESAGNVGQKESVLSITAVEDMLLYDLYMIDPTTYPLATIQRVTRTKAVSYG